MAGTQSIDEFISSLPEERRLAFKKLLQVLKKNLPKGFEQQYASGMLHFVVPHKLYPKGYHVNPSQPLPFISIASQKNFIALYHMGLYANKDLLKWFTDAYPKHSKAKLDMGKSCVRFKNPDSMPFELIADLATKISPSDWIERYEAAFKK